MTKLPAFTALFAVSVLSGCTVCTNCDPEYQTEDSSPTTIYQYTSYPGSSSFVSTVQTDRTWIELPSTVPRSSVYTGSSSTYIPPRPVVTYPAYPIYRPTPAVSTWQASRPVYRSYHNSYGRSYYGGGYSGPAFTTPPMQPMPYPAESYYPFKRPAPGVFVPWRSSYSTVPNYYQQQLWY